MLIAHTTNLTEVDELAFAHAVALCVGSGARLATVHVGAASASDLPLPAHLLERWGVSSTLEHERVIQGAEDDAAETVLEILERLAPALVVCATRGRTGVGRVFGGSFAEAVARNLRCPTLLLPERARPFVDPASGHIRLERVVIPARGTVEARAALAACELLVRLARKEDADFELIHAEDGSPLPAVEAPEGHRLSRRTVPGPLEKELVSASQDPRVSLIVMPTRGHDSALDVVFGSHTERVLHGSSCPLLWVPLG